MRVVFLDIDGVMNSHETGQADLDNNRPVWSTFSPNAVRALNEILSRVPDSVVVISSTWRWSHTLEQLKSLARSQGVEWTNKFIDMTIKDSKGRGEQIQEWLNRNHHIVTSFVILDDDSFDMSDLSEHLIKTTFVEGMTMVHAVDAIKHLEGK